MAKNADVVIVPVGFDSTTEAEGWDRTFGLPPGQNELIQQLAKVNKNVVVVITAGGSVDMTPWMPQVSGVLQSWYAGQEGGTAHAIFGGAGQSLQEWPTASFRRWPHALPMGRGHGQGVDERGSPRRDLSRSSGGGRTPRARMR